MCGYGRACVPGRGESSSVTVGDRRCMDSAVGRLGSLSSPHSVSKGIDRSLVEQGVDRLGRPYTTCAAVDLALHGRIGDGLGCSSTSSFSPHPRSVVSSRAAPPQQRQGASGGASCSSSLDVASFSPVCDGPVRQSSCVCVYQSPGRDSFSFTVPENDRAADFLPSSRDIASGTSHPGKTQCDSGRTVSEPLSSYRMDASSRGFSRCTESLSNHGDRPVCHEIQCETSPVCISVSGRSSPGSRRSSVQPLRQRPVCVPADAPGSSSSGENGRSAVSPHTHRTLTVETSLGVEPVASLSSAPSQAASPSGLASTTVHGLTPPTSGVPEPSCVSAIKLCLTRQGFSASVVDRICHSRRASTLGVYAGKWTVFERWCTAHQFSPLDLPPPRLCDFFEYLFDELRLQPVTIRGYRSAIARVYRLCGFYDCGKHELISAVMTNFDLKRPRHSTLFPKWSLDVVLDYLQTPQFQPYETIELLLLTLKTVFLVAMASAFRVSELQALSVTEDCCRFNADGSCSLMTCLGFVAKNRLASARPQNLLLQPLPETPALCPAEALRAYIDRTQQLRGRNRQLFVSPRTPERATTSQLLATYIRSTVKRAYEWMVDQPQVVRQESVSASEPSASPAESGSLDGAAPDRVSTGSRGGSPASLRLGQCGGLRQEDVRAAPSVPRVGLRSRKWSTPVIPPSGTLTSVGSFRRSLPQSPASKECSLVRPQGQHFEGRTAHELRALAASLAFHKGTPLHDVLRAVGWSSQSTFARHYLRHVPAALHQRMGVGRLPDAGN